MPYLLRRLLIQHWPALIAVAYLGLPVLFAIADSLVSGIGLNATTPLVANSCLYVDQASIQDAKWCNPKAADIGGLMRSNALSEIATDSNQATARGNIGAASSNNAVFTGNPPIIPAIPQSQTGAVAATADFVKAQESPSDVAWVNQDPNNTCVHVAHLAEKVTGLNGRVTTAAGVGSTLTAVKVPSGTAVGAAGTVALTQAPTANLLADSSVNTDQTLTLSQTAGALLLAVGDAVCITTNGSSTGNFTTSNGVLTVSIVKQ